MRSLDSDTIGFVYGLKDPCSDRLKYVGVCLNLSQRLKAHFNESFNPKKRQWLQRLKKTNRQPRIVIFEEGPAEEMRKREKFWISQNAANHKLFNITHCPSFRLTETQVSWAKGAYKARLLTRAQISKSLGIAYHHVNQIIWEELWSHLPPLEPWNYDPSERELP